MSGDDKNNTSEGRSDRICEQRKNKVSQRKRWREIFGRLDYMQPFCFECGTAKEAQMASYGDWQLVT